MDKPVIKTESLEQNTSPTEQMIKDWKTQYGKVIQIDLDEEGEQKLTFCFRPIDSMTVVEMANRKLADKDTLGYAKVILANSIINGSAHLDNPQIFMALIPVTDKLITNKTLSFKKN